jgi:hypothetical protein
MFAAIIFFWPRTRDLEASVNQEYPSQAMSFLQAHPPEGPMLNFYLWGGYLGWNNNNLKAFVDSRVDIFEYAGVLQDYLNFLGVKDAPAVLDKYKVRYVLFPKSEPVVYLLEEKPEWKVLYSDNLCVLLERSQLASGPATAISGR